MINIVSGTAGLSILGLDAHQDLQQQLTEFLGLALPGFASSQSIQGHQLIVERGANTLLFNNNTGTYIYSYSAQLSAMDLGWVVLTILERQRQSEGEYTLHASAFEMQGSGVLVLGESGAGKTTLLLEAMVGHGARGIGADYTVVGLHNIISGTSSCLVGPWHQEYVRGLGICFPETQDGSWGRRTILGLEALGFTSRASASLRLIVVPFLRSDEHDIVWSRRKKVLSLYQMAGQTINGLESAVFDMRVEIPSLDTQQLREMRLQWAAHTVENVPFLALSGTASNIMDRIGRQLH